MEDIWFKFKTISEYVNILADLSNNITLNINQNINKLNNNSSEKFIKKKNLIDFMYKNLLSEKEQIMNDSDFAFLCCSWIAPKGYYLLFTQQCLLLYLLNKEEKHIDFDHKLLRKNFDEKLSNKSIYFSCDVFNQVRSYKEAYKYKTNQGSIYSKTKSEKLGLILKKNVIYAEEDFKRKGNIKKYNTSINKVKKEKFLSSNRTSLYHFFYHMRIKSNYRDLEFMRYSEIPHKKTDFIDFYNKYYSLIINFYNAYDSAIKNLE